MEFIDRLLHWVSPVALVLLFALVCFLSTGQWSLRNRLIIALSRLNAVVLLSVVTVLLGFSLLQALHFPTASPGPLVFSLRWGAAPAFGNTPARAAAAALVAPNGTSVLGVPSLSAAFIESFLAYHRSPAAGTGSVFYSLSQRYGIDDAYALAFFWHESNAGLNGMAALTHSIGNLRCIDGAACVNTQGLPCQLQQSCYASFPDWASGELAWYALIAGPLYVGDGRVTVARIIERYAPAADNNNEQAYTDNVTMVIQRLRAGRVDL